MLHGRLHITTVFALLVALLIAPTADAAKRQGAAKRVVAAKKVRGHVATFPLRHVKRSSVRSARLRVGKRARRVAPRRIRAAVRRPGRRLALRLGRREVRAARRGKPRLVIYGQSVRSGKKQTPTPTPPAATTPADDTSTAAPLSDTTSSAEATPPPPAPTAPADEGARSVMRPAGSPVLGDAAAAALVRPSGAEKRPANAGPNGRIPTADELAAFREANNSLYEPHEQLVTGAFRGTTDEIIQWAAWKWGIDEDVFRAQAAVESWWRMSEIGDNGQSFGLFQLKGSVHHGTYPLSVESTAFNADYMGAIFRYYYDGHATWVMDVEHGRDYEIGDAWGSMGAHYAGRWYTNGADQYIEKIKRVLAERTWELTTF